MTDPIYIKFSDCRQNIIKWSHEPFDGGEMWNFSGGWRPMGTAPREKRILVCAWQSPVRTRFGNEFSGYWGLSEEMTDEFGALDYKPDNVWYWIPLDEAHPPFPTPPVD
jgi:hypothetical protein